MKPLRYVLCIMSIALAFAGCANDDDFQTTGILFLVISDENTGDPVANAEIEVYRNVDDWAFEESKIKTLHSDAHGEVVISELAEGEYFFNVSEGKRDNWQQPYGIEIIDHNVNYGYIYVSENLNNVISSVEGRSWHIVSITNSSGEDMSGEAPYACMLDNTELFMKAGYYARDEGEDKCSEALLVEGSWWAYGTQFLYLYVNDTVRELLVSDLEEDSFTAVDPYDTEGIKYHYKITN